MIRYLLYTLILILPIKGTCQTCCSGGVPLSGNIGFIGDEKGLMQFELNYDYNYLNTLYFEDKKLIDNSRERITQSILLKYGYNIFNSLSFDLLFSLVQQERRINQFNNTDYIRTRGLGDALILFKYHISKISNNRQTFIIGLGPKIPLGKSDLKTKNGINLNADLQPGSGSFDLLIWANYQRTSYLRPSLLFFSRLIYKQNGTNKEYFETQKYRFGNELQLITGIGDKVLIKSVLMNIGIAFKYRNTGYDLVNENDLSNTGGNWLYAMPHLSIFFNENIFFNIAPEIPIYTRVNGTQLSTNFRLSTSLYFKLNKKPTLKINKL